MPIEGFSNRVKTFFTTEARLGNNFHLNNFANQTLWYAQYFLGRDTMAIQDGKCYLVEKAATPESSWVPTALKTATYFGLAVVLIIPGTVARLLSLDSAVVRGALFADRVTLKDLSEIKVLPLKPPKGPAPVSRPVREKKTNPSSDDFSTGNIARDTSKEQSPREEPNVASKTDQSPSITAEVKAVAEAITPPLIAEKSLPTPVEKKDEPISRDIEYQDQVEILYEFELSLAFFEALNKQNNNRKNLERWFVAERKKPTYHDPFMFGLHFAHKRSREITSKIIPEAALQRWHIAYLASVNKLKDTNLGKYCSEPTDTESDKATCHHNQHIQEAIVFFMDFLKQNKTQAAAWLDNQAEQKGYRPYFYFTLSWLAWDELKGKSDPNKIRTLEACYLKAKIRLYEIGAERYLKEIPHSVTPGFCALVHAVTANLMAPPPNAPIVVKAQPAFSSTAGIVKITDEQLKEVLLQIMPSLTTLIRNDRMFQQHKGTMVAFTRRRWNKYIELFKDFLELPKQRSKIQEWLKELKSSQPFSDGYLSLIDQTAPILDEKLVQEWKDLRIQCCAKLTGFKLTGPIKEPISDTMIDQQHKLRPGMNEVYIAINELFEKILNEPDRVKIGVLVKKAKMERYPYFYPFYYSQEMQYMTSMAPLLKPSLLAKWQELHPKVCQKLEELKLTDYLEEIPPFMLETLAY